MTRHPASFALAFFLISLPMGGLDRGLAAQDPPIAKASEWICPPCGADCHDPTYERPGACALCGMELVPVDSVPHIGILLFEDVDLLSTAIPASVFQASGAARVFTVADTTEPIRAQGFQSLVPAYDFDSAPGIDLLVVPGGWGALSAAGDELIADWTRRTGSHARGVLAVQFGGAFLAMVGLSGDEPVAVDPRFAQEIAQRAPGARLDTEHATTWSGNVFSAREATGAAGIALDLVHALADANAARRAADLLGIDWQPGAEPKPVPERKTEAPKPDREEDPAPTPAPTRQLEDPAANAALGLDWPHWRGPHGDGISRETGWLDEGAPEPLWTRQVGLGHSGISVVNQRAYTIGFDEAASKDIVHCLDAETGKILWQHDYPAQLMNSGHGGGSLTTPTVAGNRVWVSNRVGEIRCLDANDGSLIWHRALVKELDLTPADYGFGSSPLLVGDLLVYAVGTVFGLEPETGEIRWRTRDLEAMYSTPTLFTPDDRTCLAVFTRNGLNILDLETGEELALFPFRKGEATVNASTPVLVNDHLFISSGYDHGCAMLSLDDDGLRPVWESRVMRNKLSGSVYFEGFLYGFDESTLKCVDVEGKEKWRKRGLGLGALTIAGGRLVLLSARGELIVADASPQRFRERSRRKVLEGGACWTNPVVSGGRVFCRNSLGDVVVLDHRG